MDERSVDDLRAAYETTGRRITELSLTLREAIAEQNHDFVLSVAQRLRRLEITLDQLDAWHAEFFGDASLPPEAAAAREVDDSAFEGEAP